MSSPPPRAPFGGDRGGAQAFRDDLHHAMDFGSSPAATHQGTAPTETKTGAESSTAREGAPIPPDKKADKRANPVSVAMAAAPIPFDPQLPIQPILLVAGAGFGSKPEIPADAKLLADHASPSPASELKLPSANATGENATALPLLSYPPAPAPNRDANPIDDRPRDHHQSLDSHHNPHESIGDAPPATLQPKFAEPAIALNLPQLTRLPSLSALNRPPGDSPSPSSLAATPNKLAVAPAQDHAAKLSPVTADIKATAGVAAPFSGASNLRPLPAHLTAELSPHLWERVDVTPAAASSTKDPNSKAETHEKRNEPALTAHSPNAAAGVQPAAEKSRTEKSPTGNPVEKAPANSKDPAPVGSATAAPHRDAQAVKTVIAEAGWTQPSAGAASSGPALSTPGNLQTSGAVAKPDSPPSADASPGPTSADVAPVHAARFMPGGNESEMRVGLRTENFGAVQVHTTVSEKQVELALGSERGDLRSLITTDLPNLQATLQQHDLRLHELRSLEHAAPEQNPEDHSSRHSSGNSPRHPSDPGQEQPRFFSDDFSQDGAYRPDTGSDNDIPASKGLSIRA